MGDPADGDLKCNICSRHKPSEEVKLYDCSLEGASIKLWICDLCKDKEK